MGPAALLATASPLSAVAFAPLRNAAGPVAQAYEPYVQTAYVQQFAASPALNQTGPASVAVMAAGAGAGLAWVRRRKSHTPRR